MDTFKDRIKLLRNESNLSQYTLSQKIGSSQKIIDYWEKGASEPKAHFIIQLADYFGVSCDYLLGREDDFGNINVNSDLNEDEKLLLNAFRQTDCRKREILLSFAKFLSDKE